MFHSLALAATVLTMEDKRVDFHHERLSSIEKLYEMHIYVLFPKKSLALSHWGQLTHISVSK